ncbi:protein odr-4 homolog [Cydia splendana]|uniref:protein odr-4 homolog n=1 Tax=Cydia splendana TaxID=1100963 RepID=UPI00300C86DC
MVRTVYSPEYCLQYLEQYASKETFVIGLILGQTTDSRENVIHLARTPEEKSPDSAAENESFSASDKPEVARSLAGVSEAWIADHAKHVTRMLPGGMFVQGIFITSDEDIFEDPNCFSRVKTILNYTYKSLSTNPYMYGNCPGVTERLVLHMSTNTKVLTCKSVEVGSVKNVLTRPVDWKFLPKPQQWQRLDCYFEFDDVYPVIVKKSGISVKQQFQQILESAQKTIESSVMFIDGELKTGSEALENLNKKKKLKTNAKVTQQEALKSMQVSLFVPFETCLPETVEYLECDGSIHFSGVVSSSVFLYPKATVSEAITAVKQDIVRSLASRFTMHCDALIDDNLLPEEKVCFNEPPRRVLVPVGSLFLCDYLFPGEAPAEALLSVRELLDLQITEADVVCDVETPADTSEFDALDRDASSEELLATPQEASQFMYITGICFALFVLIVSILVHYYDTIVLGLSKILSKFK